MLNLKTRPIDKKALRSRFKSAQAKRGFDGIRDCLDSDQVVLLTCGQAMKALNLLDERIEEVAGKLGIQKADGNAADMPAAHELESLRKAERLVLLGIIANPDMYAEYQRLFEIVRDAAADDLPSIWGSKARRNHVNDNIAKSFEALLIDYPDFAKIRYAMQRAADALLKEKGLRPLGDFWDERLKFALYPCPKPLEDRIEIRARYAPDPDDTSHAVHMLKEDVKTSLDRLPYFLHRFVEEAGYAVRVAERLAYIDRQYAVEAQRATARSHDVSSKGVHVGESRYIDIPLLNVRSDGEVFMASNSRDDMDMTVAHEGFHGIGEFMGFIDFNDRELAAAYAADIEDIRHWDIAGFEYDDVRDYLPKSHGGTRESVLAARIEAFAEIGGEESLGYNENYIGDCFPRTKGCMKHLVETLDVVYDICPHGNMLPRPQVLEKRLGPSGAAAIKPSCFVMS